jgi:hypothetical protein
MTDLTPYTPASAVSLKAAGRMLSDFKPLKPLEKKLMDACRKGELAFIGEHRPERATEQNIIRSAFLRFLALGGDENAPVHEKGIQLQGAWLDGKLDLDGTTLPSGLLLVNCYFSATPLLHDCRIQGSVNLIGCHVDGLIADGMVCSGSVFLSNGFTSSGTVRLLNAQIGGNLDCSAAAFDGMGGYALGCDRAVIKGGVFLSDGFTASGTVRLRGAQIAGSLECDGATLDGKNGDALLCDRASIKGNVFLRDGFTAVGTVRLSGTQIDGNLECIDARFNGKSGDALVAESMSVTGSFFFRNLAYPVKGVSLASARVGRLVDDADSWAGNLVMDGFVYDRLADDVLPNARDRLEWLSKQHISHTGLNSEGANFRPQPWHQLQKVLREMGYAEDARQVAIAFEDQLRLAGLIGQTAKHENMLWAFFYRNTCRGFHSLFGWLTGYGYRPLRLFVAMLGVWLFCAAFYWCAALDGEFAPSNPLVFQNFDNAVCIPSESEEAKAELAKLASEQSPPVKGAGNWYLCEKLRKEYPGFSPLAYSLDVILPLVDLQQERNWTPMMPAPKNSWYEELFSFRQHITRLLLWFEILFGWAASLLLIFVVTGLTKRHNN